ncbi:uncharacterized protein LOC117332393 isoform X1 [Pecten maximus]|uniref:uncharacterized protein LOC117332393 isoform X1 n=1 Tax=Pecten maximus TaxID=6579 RepID=UPI0014589C80|nr:uncharacterized protein LOC117332393 isoform X1 [Pecten maximus]
MVFILLAVLMIGLPFEGYCMQNLMCVSSTSTSAPLDILEDSHYNNYGQPYVPWWSMFRIPCKNSYRSPLLDSWTRLNVTKLKMSVVNNFNQVFYYEEFDMDGLNISEIFMNLTTYNHSFHLTGENGMDFVIADLHDSRNIKFGILPEPEPGNRLMLDLTDDYFRIPNASDFQECVYYPASKPITYTTTLNVSNQEQCFYGCLPPTRRIRNPVHLGWDARSCMSMFRWSLVHLRI